MNSKQSNRSIGNKQLDEEHGIGGPGQKPLDDEAGYPEIYGEKGAVSKKEKKAALVIVLMFVMFLAASTFAVFFYLDDSDCPINECMGMVDPSQCEALVDCAQDNNEAQVDPGDNVTEFYIQDFKVDEVEIWKEEFNGYEKDGVYYADVKVCTQPSTSTAGTVVVTSCDQFEERTYELDNEIPYYVEGCTVSEQTVSIKNAQQLIDLPKDDLLNYGCWGENAVGLRLYVVNEELVVGLRNNYQ